MTSSAGRSPCACSPIWSADAGARSSADDGQGDVGRREAGRLPNRQGAGGLALNLRLIDGVGGHGRYDRLSPAAPESRSFQPSGTIDRTDTSSALTDRHADSQPLRRMSAGAHGASTRLGRWFRMSGTIAIRPDCASGSSEPTIDLAPVFDARHKFLVRVAVHAEHDPIVADADAADRLVHCANLSLLT